ncbi:sugar transferase [Rhizobium sp. KVB221]|uniref:Sugar transferase n=1 Tax=Rhizobium setariae TaxID=2801340 RepID=A0A936YR70_9HYPH|nr:sugar transferase [Rhizobium setariae]MBL0373277.1 sugar transferase [Rhizobium setariae]
MRMESQLATFATHRAGSMRVKRLFDLLVAGSLSIVTLPLIAATATAVHVAVGRPLIFRQERAGQFMRTFHIGKFRTMTDARDAAGQLLPDDLRQTRLTKFLRRIRVDELPQLFAILRGEMSFVGPRPLPLATLRAFGESGRIRCSVPPGMTGWAQVNGNTRLTDEQKMALDIWYVDNHSLAMDMWIVLLTIRTIILGERLNTANIENALLHLRQRSGLRQPSGAEG